MPRLLSYFRTEAESLHLALEVEPHVWRALNGNRPVLEPTPGQGTMRDPYLFRDRDGRFHLLATPDWRGKHLLHATSDDLVRWSPQRLVEVMASVPTTRNTWAPEAFWDRQAGAYRVFWSSGITDVGGEDDWNHRCWSCTTDDFVSFSAPSLFFDPGFSCIDPTIIARADGDYLVFKDERGRNERGSGHKRLHTAFRALGAKRFGPISPAISPELVEGPILVREEDRWVVYYDCFTEGCWGAIASDDFATWRPLQVSFPPGPRHGGVIEIDEALARALRERFAG